jgi:hypothetical protein
MGEHDPSGRLEPTVLKISSHPPTVADLDLRRPGLLAGRPVPGRKRSPGSLLPHPFSCRRSIIIRYLGILLAGIQPDGHVDDLVRCASLDRGSMRVRLPFRHLPFIQEDPQRDPRLWHDNPGLLGFLHLLVVVATDRLASHRKGSSPLHR